MKGFLSRWLRLKRDSVSSNSSTCRSSSTDRTMHAGFKTKPGRGPFLLSYDGRVIPLRKARFLHQRRDGSKKTVVDKGCSK